MEAFGKTGTASDEKDLWFVGGTPYYVTAVWWGYDAPYDMTRTLTKQQAKTRTCVMAWKALMEQAQADLPGPVSSWARWEPTSTRPSSTRR